MSSWEAKARAPLRSAAAAARAASGSAMPAMATSSKLVEDAEVPVGDAAGADEADLEHG